MLVQRHFSPPRQCCTLFIRVELVSRERIEDVGESCGQSVKEDRPRGAHLGSRGSSEVGQRKTHPPLTQETGRDVKIGRSLDMEGKLRKLTSIRWYPPSARRVLGKEPRMLLEII